MDMFISYIIPHFTQPDFHIINVRLMVVDQTQKNAYYVRVQRFHCGPVAQLARARVLHSRGRRFNSCRVHNVSVHMV